MPLQQGESVQAYLLQRYATAAMPGPGQSDWDSSLESMGSGTAAPDGTLSSTVSSRQGSFYRVLAALAGGATYVASTPAKAVNPAGGWHRRECEAPATAPRQPLAAPVHDVYWQVQQQRSC